jgi:hypothetical protein
MKDQNLFTAENAEDAEVFLSGLLCALCVLCSEKAPPNRAFSLVWVLQTNMRDCGEVIL